jgi:MFS family permease
MPRVPAIQVAAKGRWRGEGQRKRLEADEQGDGRHGERPLRSPVENAGRKERGAQRRCRGPEDRRPGGVEFASGRDQRDSSYYQGGKTSNGDKGLHGILHSTSITVGRGHQRPESRLWSEPHRSPLTIHVHGPLASRWHTGRVDPTAASAPPSAPAPWLTPGVRGIGTASLLSDAGHEIPTSLLPSLLTSTLGAPAAALGAIEGVADGLAGAAKLAGGALADDPQRRRTVAVGGYTTTAVLSSLIGAATTVWQVAILRALAWSARGLRVPARNALLADVAPSEAYGRAYGFERAMDNLGAIIGPLLGIALVAAVGVRGAILLSVIPGLLAAAAIVYAIRRAGPIARRAHEPVRLRIRPVLRGRLGRLMTGIAALELGNLAATLLILRATELLTPAHGHDAAAQLALLLYTAYNLAATLISVPAGHLGDRRGAPRVLVTGAAGFAGAFLVLALTGPHLAPLALGFVLAGLAIGCAETAEHAAVAALAPAELRGSAFGLLAAVQSVGNLAASAVAGTLWTLVSPTVAFTYAAGWMVVAVVALGRPAGPLSART